MRLKPGRDGFIFGRMETIADKPGDEARGGLRILIAEDSQLNQQVARHQLRKLGFAAEVAANGQAAIDAHERNSYEVILMDCSMPVMDGFQAAWTIRNREQPAAGQSQPVHRVHIIAMTADVGADIRQKCVEAGMDDYISKPVILAELAAALERARLDPAARGQNEVLDTRVIAQLRLLREPNQPDPVAEIVALFEKAVPPLLDAMEQAISRNDISSMADTITSASNLKGSAANLGARRLVELCGEIEQAARLGLLQEAAPFVQQAREEFTRVEAALGKLVK